MPESPLRLVKRCAEYLPMDDIRLLPRGLRGVYVLYRYRSRTNRYDVVYVGMATGGERGGIRRRLQKHVTKKSGLWTHCSIFEVWDNIRHEEVAELEGLFRHIYKSDSTANKLNVQRGFKKMREVTDNDISEWA